jgi:hypothetical protein
MSRPALGSIGLGGLDDGRQLHGNCMWGSVTKVFGPMLKMTDDRREELVRQAARVVSHDGLSAAQKTDQLVAINGFGSNIATGLVMVFILASSRSETSSR